MFVDALVEGLFVDDAGVAVDQVLLEFVAEHALQGVDLVALADLVDSLGNVGVLLSGLQQAQGSLDGLVGSQDHVGLLALVDLVGVGGHYDGVGDQADLAVDVHAEVSIRRV